MRVCVLANSSRYLWNFRANLIRALLAAGHDVLAMSPAGAEVALIEGLGIRHVHLPLAPKGTNPFSELRTVRSLRRLLRDHEVEAVLSSTPKGNLYTALANRGTQRRQLANVSGLGSAYLRQDWLSRFVDVLYGATFGRIDHVLFENPTDHGEFLRRGWVTPTRASVIPGLGVDLDHFAACPWPAEDDAAGVVQFLMIARLIGDKGVREYVRAAEQVRARHPRTRFMLLGDSASDNPTSIAADELAQWRAQGHVVHHEHTDDVRPHIAAAHCLVLPSYREGMSRTLLEGGAMGRPLIASDVPGCREAIDPGVNGLLCDARSVTSLAERMEQILNMPDQQRREMGAASRRKIASQFGEDRVIRRYLDLLADLRQGD